MYLTLKQLAQNETLARAMHDIRCANAVWCPDTGRFHPDIREHRAESHTGKLLTNLFSRGFAMVTSHNGTAAVVARDASRAAAAVALRDIRAGRPACHDYHVSKANMSGASYRETFFFGFDSHARTVLK